MTGRQLRSDGIRLATGTLLVILIFVLLNILAARHCHRGDWTRSQVFTLSAKTKQLIGSIDRPVRVTVFMAPTDEQGDSVRNQTRELLSRMARLSPHLTVEQLDIDLQAARVSVLASQHGLRLDGLRDGAVVVAGPKRSRSIPLRRMAEYDLTPQGRRVVAFRGEVELLSALAAVTSTHEVRVCFTRGHGEAAIDAYTDEGYGYIVDEVRREGYVASSIGPRSLVAGGRGCRVIVVGGPSRGFSDVELRGMDEYLLAGGRLFVLLGPVLDRRVTRFGSVGLESLLARWGFELPHNIVVDRFSVPGEQPLLTWATEDGYGKHSIAEALRGRLTVWPLTREIRPNPGARDGLEVQTLVRTSGSGWGESDLGSLRGENPLQVDTAVDSRGPVSVAAAARWRNSRVVVFGSERGVINRRMGAAVQRDYNRELFLAGLAWLAGDSAKVAIGPKLPEQPRMVVDDRILGRLFLVTVVGLPVLIMLAGLLVWWRRRK